MVKINQANTNTVKRIGRTTVEIRLVDAKTLKIIYTEILNGKYTDLISDEISNSIADFHYKFEDDALPFSQKKQATNQITIIKPENKKSIDTPPNSFLKSAGLIFSFQKGGAAGHFHIRSKGGANIYSFDVPKGDGDQDITWDCQDRNGENLPDGTYELYSIKDDSVNVLATFSLVD